MKEAPKFLPNGYSFNPASLFFASSTSGSPGSASFQRERNFSYKILFLFLLDPQVFHFVDWVGPEWAAEPFDPAMNNVGMDLR